MKKITYLLLSSLLVTFGCNNRISDPPQQLNYVEQTSPILEIIDSLTLPGPVGGYNEYMPLGISPSKTKVLLMTARGGKEVLVADLNKRKVETLDLTDIEKSMESKVGINNVGFLSDEVVAVIYDKELSLFDLEKNELLSVTQLPEEGYYSSYSKRLITFITDNDTLLVSQLFSPSKSKYLHGSDGFFDIAPLSIYSAKRKTFLPVYLPNSSNFRTQNLGQPIVNFTNSKNKIFFSTSPDNKVYTFNINLDEFKIDDFESYKFDYSSGDTLIGAERSNYLKDIYRLATKNPFQSDIVLFNDNVLLSFSNGLTEDDFQVLFSDSLSAKERAEFYMGKRKSYVEVLDNIKGIHRGSFKLDDNFESVSLQISDSTYMMRPKTAYYLQGDSVQIYIAKIKN